MLLDIRNGIRPVLLQHGSKVHFGAEAGVVVVDVKVVDIDSHPGYDG